MILAEREPVLPVTVESMKVQVLHCLRAMHHQMEYDTVQELTAFLDDGLEQLVAAGYSRALSRIVLFYRNDRAVREVAQRLAPGAQFLAFHAPECWGELSKRLPELQHMAMRIEPDWAATMPKGA